MPDQAVEKKFGRSDADAPWTPLAGARTRLLQIWLLGGGVCFLVLLGQSIGGKFGEELNDVWAWFVPTLAPTLALMIGVVGSTSASGRTRENIVRKDYFNITLYLSIFYIVILLVSLIWAGLTDEAKTLDVYNRSNYWLGPLQGIVVGALGYLFTAHRPATAARRKPSTK